MSSPTNIHRRFSNLAYYCPGAEWGCPIEPVTSVRGSASLYFFLIINKNHTYVCNKQTLNSFRLNLLFIDDFLAASNAPRHFQKVAYNLLTYDDQVKTMRLKYLGYSGTSGGWDAAERTLFR